MLFLLRGFGGVLILTKVLSGLLHSNTVIVLQLHETQSQRAGKEEKDKKKRGLDNIIPRSQETALTIRKNERAQWNRGRGGTAAGQGIIRLRVTQSW